MTEQHRIFPKKRLIPDVTKGQKKPDSFVLYPFEYMAKVKESLEEKEAESLRLIKGHLLNFKKPYVPSSHGKDSIVMVHLVLRAWRELVAEGHKLRKPEVWLNHTLNVYKEEKAYWSVVNKWLGIEDVFRIFYPPKDKNGKHQTVWTIAKKVGHLPHFRSMDSHKKKNNGPSTPECCDILKKQSLKIYLKSLPKEDRYDLQFIGTRGPESKQRRMNLFMRCRSYMIKSKKAYPIQNCTPLSFWTAADVWEYFKRNEIPKNPCYDIHKLDRLGCKSCPAFIEWEIKLARDPTNEGFADLKRNFEILRKDEPERFRASVRTLQKYIRETNNDISLEHKKRIWEFLKGYTGQQQLDMI